LTPSNPIAPAPPSVPPGTIWPPVWGPVDPGYGIDEGGRPDQSLPGRPARPDQGLPATPGQPPRPDQGLPSVGGEHPDQGLPSRVYWMIAYCPALGWKYVAVDPALRPSHPIAPPPTAQPK
jgi:hypothetical protein